MYLRCTPAAFALIALIAALSPADCRAQCGPITPVETNTFEDLYRNLQGLQCAFALQPEPAPIPIGSLHITTRHGPLQAEMEPAGELQPDGSRAVTVYGPRCIISISEDRSQGDVVDYDFQVEITEILNGGGVVFSKQNVWDNWPRLRLDTSGNSLLYRFDVGDATEVSGVVRASTMSVPGRPSQRAMDGRFRVRIRQGCVGVFRLPVMPVSLLYAPPPGDAGDNSVTYSAQQSAATAVKTSFTTSDSRTVPGSYDEGFDTLKSMLGTAQSVAKAIPGYGTAIAGCLSFVNSSLGSTTVTTESGKLSATQDGWARTLSQSLTTSVGGRYPQGPWKDAVAVPGLDDKIVVLLDVPLAWVADDAGGIKLIPLGPARSGPTYPMRALLHDLPLLEAAEPPPEPTVETQPTSGGVAAGDPEFPSPPPSGGKTVPVRERPGILKRVGAAPPAGGGAKHAPRTSGIAAPPARHVGTLPAEEPLTPFDLVTVRSLLALDPLVLPDGRVASPAVFEQSGRYHATPMSTLDGHNTMWELTVNSWDQSATLKLQLDYVDTHGQNSAQFTTTVQDDKPGMLGKLLGMGPQTRQTLKTTSTVGSVLETAVATKRQVDLHVDPPSQGAIVLRAYQDLVFGTYAFSQVSPDDNLLQADGTATDASGAPLANQWVTLDVGGRSYGCRTDAQGRYAIYGSNRTAGQARLTAGGRVSLRAISPQLRRAPAQDAAPPAVRPRIKR